MEAINVDQLSNSILDQMNRDLAEKMDGDCVFINCGMLAPLDDEFRVTIEKIKESNSLLQRSEQKHFIVLLETGGGYMETVERLLAVMRSHYETVSFVIPNFAYSAGTVLALSGDRIFMDYYSVLGPIDPQIRDSQGKELLPGAGYLSKFNELIKEVNDNQDADVQLAFLVKNFDPARLFHIEQSINHGISLIQEWLPKYKFKNWKKTASKGKTVTKKMRVNRATAIAKILGNAEKWHSHGRGIPMSELGGEEIKLEIEDFGSDPDLSSKIRNYHGLCVDFFTKKCGYNGYIHSTSGIRRIF